MELKSDLNLFSGVNTRRITPNILRYEDEYFTRIFNRKQVTSIETQIHQLADKLLVGRSKPFACSEKECEKRYSNIYTLTRHIKQIHTDETVVTCDFKDCHASFRSISHLNRHSRTHTGEKPFKCVHCSRAFAQKGDLVCHIRTHTGETPFVCHRGDCNKAFKQLTAFLDHTRRNHSSEKSFQCEFEGCLKRFVTNHERTLHCRTHTGEKPFICHFNGCRKAFSASHIRTCHIRRHHTGEKPFKCDFDGCKKRYVTSSDRRIHRRIHTGEKPYACSGCEKQFASSCHLRRHEKVHSRLNFDCPGF